MKYYLYRIIILLLLFIPCGVRADIDFIPDKLSLQTAGYQGMQTVGVGYEWLTYFETDVYFGYTPEEEGGQDIKSMSIKTYLISKDIHLYRDFAINFHTSLGILYGFGNDLFVDLPDRYPDHYYAPSAIRYLVSFGGQLKVDQSTYLYFDMNYLDSELAPYLQAGDRSIPFEELGSLALGISFTLDNWKQSRRSDHDLKSVEKDKEM